jgi:hypothetical protein
MAAWTCATARPQLAKADTAFQAYPSVNTYLYYSSKRGDPNLYKRAFVQERLLMAQLRAEELGFSQLQRGAYYQTVYSEASDRKSTRPTIRLPTLLKEWA